MFKFKVSIYMVSGNVIYMRCKDYSFLKKMKNNNGINGMQYKRANGYYGIDSVYVMGFVVKKWWQRWG